MRSLQLFLELEVETLQRMGMLQASLPDHGSWARSATTAPPTAAPPSAAWVVHSQEGLAAASLTGAPWTPLGAVPTTTTTTTSPTATTSLKTSPTTSPPRAIPSAKAFLEAGNHGSPTNYSAVPLAAAELVLRSLDEDDSPAPQEAATAWLGAKTTTRHNDGDDPLLLSAPTRPAVRLGGDAVAVRFGLELRSTELRTRAHGRSTARNRGPVNEVVCGALMAAYERAGLSAKVLDVLRRAQRMGVEANTVMYNIAMSALGKAGEWQAAARLFGMVQEPDVVTFETLVAAYGMAGRVEEAEAAFAALQQAGHAPRDYAFCGLIAAYRCVFG